MLNELTSAERMLLLKFVCAFAWTDHQVQSQEGRFVHTLVKKLGLSSDEELQVEGWLKLPPTPDEVDPSLVPRKHKALFLDYARQLIEADGRVDESEAELFETLEQLLS